jgi:hypothetical protein
LLLDGEPGTLAALSLALWLTRGDDVRRSDARRCPWRRRGLHRKPYRRPTVVRYGDVDDLTAERQRRKNDKGRARRPRTE